MKNPFYKEITSAQELTELFGEQSELVKNKVIHHLDFHCRNFISHSPFLIISTSDKDGRCDASPRGDAPGFVCVLDDKWLIIPERPGNKRLDTIRNILSNPRAGLLFFIPGTGETLRVNGNAKVIMDHELLEKLSINGKLPLAAIAVQAEECYLHCAKAIKRSGLWETRIENFIDGAAILRDHAGLPNTSVEDVRRNLNESYRDRLY
ncbi:pyridoxamine 5'-phosphate oxidase family protein [Metabacillus sp. GX 13764]|uniref:pyridoxamine 5'-phosphate oxidase family protein n=1 Tax=Metabacillus kandeliae TaxID=2900151 RepID=UPI001E5258C8|nr:pyridoxamine 5'-phosphate oxidase family protein [Metabacillus kandeliae]MCD7035011.1 pyridoxamine 5'-phosphate oxidase family protein [Metabacillus kandeliae]